MDDRSLFLSIFCNRIYRCDAISIELFRFKYLSKSIFLELPFIKYCSKLRCDRLLF